MPIKISNKGIVIVLYQWQVMIFYFVIKIFTKQITGNKNRDFVAW